jgi:hypothetical protein
MFIRLFAHVREANAVEVRQVARLDAALDG